jgi:hypothetical protein
MILTLLVVGSRICFTAFTESLVKAGLLFVITVSIQVIIMATDMFTNPMLCTTNLGYPFALWVLQLSDFVNCILLVSSNSKLRLESIAARILVNLSLLVFVSAAELPDCVMGEWQVTSDNQVNVSVLTFLIALYIQSSSIVLFPKSDDDVEGHKHLKSEAKDSEETESLLTPKTTT